MTGSTTFAFRFEPLLLPTAFAVGVTPWTSSVTVDADSLRVRFGAWSLTTPIANIDGVAITGPYRAVKVIGPPRLSFSDRGVTFATNRQRGVCVRFVEPVPAIEPSGRLRHPGATLTVADCDGLADLLRSAR